MRHLLWIPLALLVTVGCKKDNKQAVATLSTIVPASITANTAQTGGDITGNGGSTITQRGVCWAIHAGPTVGDSLTKDGIGPGSFTTSLSNLASYTKYYVRAYAINAIGTAYGDEQSFTTSMGLASLTTTAISGVAPLMATSGGNIVSDGGANVTTRGVVWATTAHPTVEGNFKTSDSLGKGVFISTLGPLASQVTYYARAYAVNSFGTAYGNEISFTSSSADAVTDIDGNVYGYVTIGTQTWMTSNLKTSHYSNGDPITNGSVNNSAFYRPNSWFGIPPPETGAFTYPNGDAANNDKYGKYYDVLDLQDARGICPTNWHVPTDDEWKTLEIFEGMSQDDADVAGSRGTVAPKLLEGGSSGLNFKLAGYLYQDPVAGIAYEPFGINGGGFYWAGNLALGSGSTAFFWYRCFNYPGSDPTSITRSFSNGQYDMSVRCMKN